jgi:hypothetical protein
MDFTLGIRKEGECAEMKFPKIRLGCPVCDTALRICLDCGGYGSYNSNGVFVKPCPRCAGFGLLDEEGIVRK